MQALGVSLLFEMTIYLDSTNRRSWFRLRQQHRRR